MPLVLEARDVLAELDGVVGEHTAQPRSKVPCALACCSRRSSGMLQPSPYTGGRPRAHGQRPRVPCCLPAGKDPSAARQLLRSGPFSGMRDNIRALGQYAALPAAEGGAGLSEADAGQLVTGFFRALEEYDLLLYNAVREYKQQEQKAAKNSSSDEDAEAAGGPIDLAVGLDKAAAAEKLQVAVTKLDQLIATVPAGVMTKAEAVLAKVTGKKPAPLSTMAAEAS